MMGTTAKERKELKENGYIYVPEFHKWMKSDEYENHKSKMKSAHNFEFFSALLMAFGIFVWFLIEVLTR